MEVIVGLSVLATVAGVVCAVLWVRSYELRRTQLTIADKVGNLLQIIAAEVHNTECEEAVLNHCRAVRTVLTTAFPKDPCPWKARL